MGNGQIPPKTRSDGKTKNVPWALLPFNWKSKPWTFSCPQLCIDRRMGRMGRMGKRNGRTFLMFPDTESWNLTCVTGLILCSYMICSTKEWRCTKLAVGQKNVNVRFTIRGGVWHSRRLSIESYWIHPEHISRYLKAHQTQLMTCTFMPGPGDNFGFFVNGSTVSM